MIIPYGDILSFLVKWAPVPAFNVKYKHFFQLSPTPFLICSRFGLIQAVNEAFCSELGYAQKELVGKKLLKFVYGDGVRTQEKMSILRAGGAVSDFTNRWTKKDGSIQFINWSGVSNGSIYWVASFLDKED